MNATTKEVGLNLFQRINAVQLAIKYIQKEGSVSTGGGSYKVVTHDEVTAQVRPHMVEHGIVCYPTLVEGVMNPPLVDANMVAAKQRLYEVTYDFVFVNIDQPTDSLTIRIQAHAMDNADKAPGKALSYAKKYAILKLFEIETGENEEGRVDDMEDLIADIELAKTPDDALKAYQLAATVCAQRRDKTTLAVARSTYEKFKKEFMP